MTFKKELEQLLNKWSTENESNTPDFVLADYLDSCLAAFNTAKLKSYEVEVLPPSMCRVRLPGGFACILNSNHAGSHQARFDDGELFWSGNNE